MTLTGIQKAALVIMQMSQDRAAEVMRQFSELEAEELASEIIRLRKVEEADADAAVSEFHARTRNGRSEARGGRDFAATLLEASFGGDRAAGLLERAVSSVGGAAFEFLDNVEPAQLSTVLDGELPETIALVIAHLDSGPASTVLGVYDGQMRADIAQCLATLELPHPEMTTLVADTLKTRLRSSAPHQEASEVRGGVQPLVDIITRSDVATEHELLDELERRDPQLAEEVRSRMLGFDDLITLEDRDLQTVIRGIDAATLAIAVRGAPDELVERMRANMSERNRELLDDEISTLSRVRKPQILDARSGLVRALRELASRGPLTVRGSEGDEPQAVADE
jgi:flagellar motor switch protein FliG